MANVTIQAPASACSHAHLVATVGPRSRSVVMHLADLLADITDEEFEAWAKVTLRLYKVGRTNAQVRTALTAGIVVVL